MKKKYIFLIISCWIQTVMASIPLSERREKVVEKSEKSLSQHTIKSVEDLQGLLEKRHQRDIVILNDITEDYHNFGLLYKDDNFIHPVITVELIKAILQKQTIICTKSLLANFYFLGNIWKNFINLKPLELQNNYLFLQKISLADLVSLQNNIFVLNKIMQQLESAVILDDYYNHLESKIDEFVRKSNINSDFLSFLYVVYKFYEQCSNFLNYDVYKINQAFILLNPKRFIEDGSQNLDLREGLRISLLKKYEKDELQQNIFENFYQFDLNEQIMDISNLFIPTSVLVEKSYHVIPSFNIFMIGHGESKEIIMGINQETFIKLQNKLNNKNFINSFSVLSCFSGGKVFKKLFGHEYFAKLEQPLGNIKYPILFFGSFFSEVYMINFINSWKYYKESFLKKDYDSFFKEIRARNFFSALDLFALHDKKGLFTNHGAIKFPNTNWITVSDYRKDVFDITKILIASTYPHYVLNIPDSKNIVLMDTNVMPLHIHINMAHRKESNRCKFLPVFYMDQNYAIDILRLNGLIIMPVDREKEIAKILFDLFDIKLTSLSEPITIFIKQVFVDRYKINNILIELDKKQISFESINRPSMLVLGEEKKGEFFINKIEPSQNYVQKVDEMKKRLDTSINSEGFLSGIDNKFMTKLKNIYRKKLNPYAKHFSTLNPQATPFIPKLEPIRA